MENVINIALSVMINILYEVVRIIISCVAQYKASKNAVENPPRRSLLSLSLSLSVMPSIFKKYRKIKTLGEGSFGTVYLVENAARALFALKKISSPNDKPFDAFVAIEREIKLLLRTQRCRHVVNLLKYWVDHNRAFLLMEYCERTLRRVMQSSADIFTAPKIKCVIQQLLAGLKFCHDRAILHRDVKPENILVQTSTGLIKLADFGGARFESAELELTLPVTTLWYRAPEVLLNDRHYTQAIDMWSVGCIAMELLRKGDNLLNGDDELEQIQKIWEICGTPDDLVWPEALELANYKCCMPRNEYLEGRGLRLAFEKCEVPHGAVAFVCGLLRLAPSKRVDCKGALTHKYMTREPQPCELLRIK